jgi:monoamine oxidase
LIKGGAHQLVEQIAKGLSPRTGVEVVAVEMSASGVVVRTRSGEAIKADGCVVAVPLGVLKAGAIRFSRQLPAGTRSAIANLKVGLLDKVFLNYPNQWWPGGVTQLGTVGKPIDQTISAFPLKAVTDTPLAVAFIGGSHAAGLERQGASTMVTAVTSQLRSGFGQAAVSANTATSAWNSDPFARGSYSYLGPDASSDDRQALAALQGRLIFAGEHTSTLRPSTMDGAWLSGQAAGRSLARVVRPN